MINISRNVGEKIKQEARKDLREENFLGTKELMLENR